MAVNLYGWPQQGALDVRLLDTHASRCQTSLSDSLASIRQHQRRLLARREYAVLLVVQGLDAAGKDSLIRTLSHAMEPSAFRVHSFSRPAGEEVHHDFLWRVWRHLPAHGETVAFNRSYYEAVLAEVLWPIKARSEEQGGSDTDWQGRYRAINDFERHLHREGTRVIKIWLNTSADVQRKRLLKRLDRPRKRWKFDPADIDGWLARDRYLELVNEVLSATHTGEAPWHIVANDKKKRARAEVAAIVAQTLATLAPEYPQGDIDCIERYKAILQAGQDGPAQQD